ncbi:MAG: hypothetical protein ACXWWO_01610 [Candidatus Limnocylindria bacterium]
MDMHNLPSDFAVAIAANEDRVRGLLRERALRPARVLDDGRSSRMVRLVLAEPLVTGIAGFLLGWFVSHRG